MYLQPVNTGNTRKLPLSHDAWQLFKFGNLEIIRLDLEPGEAMENHTNHWRIVFYLLKGTGTLSVEGRLHRMSAGHAIAVQAGRERFWQNTGNEKLELLVIKTEDNS